MDWSDHAMWWQEKNIWLDKTRWTLDQYNITADAIIYFTPMHKTLRIQLPDLRYVDCNVDFSIRTFNASINLCKELGIRHPEELSLCKPLNVEHLKENYQETAMRKRQPPPTKDGQTGERIDTNTFISKGGRQYHSNGSLNNTLNRSQNGTMQHHSNPGTLRNGNYSPYNNGHAPQSPFQQATPPQHNASLNVSNISDGDLTLAHSPPVSPAVRNAQLHPKTLVERARLNVGWLDSSLSIMEQGVREFDALCLRFKYYSFYDLNPKYDAVRINMIFEQAKWQLLNEEIECTEEEMLLFAALQLQVGLQANVPQPHELFEEDDDVDAALTDLQISLEGSAGGRGGGHHGDLMHVPHLSDSLRFFRPKRFTLKSFRRLYFVCRDLQLSAYKSSDLAARGHSEAVFSFSLKGCEVTPEINLAQRKYQIKLEIPSAEGMSEIWLRCDTEAQYARWMAACRLAAKGKSLADSGYDAEVKSIQAFLSMQHPASQPVINPATLDINVEEYVAPRFLRKIKNKVRSCLFAELFVMIT